jgi:hypothetical protein
LGLGRADLELLQVLFRFIVPLLFVYVGGSWGLVGVTVSLLIAQIIFVFSLTWKYKCNKLVPITFLKNIIVHSIHTFILAVLSCLGPYFFICWILIFYISSFMRRDTNYDLIFNTVYGLPEKAVLYFKSLIKK